jgi:REP element-mobilizing transposase RayT
LTQTRDGRRGALSVVDKTKNINLNTRKQIRLKDRDYSEDGYYFVSICTECRKHLFGIIENDTVVLNETGVMADAWRHTMFDKYPNIRIDTYIIMPNHIHGIINIAGADPCIRPYSIRYGSMV